VSYSLDPRGTEKSHEGWGVQLVQNVTFCSKNVVGFEGKDNRKPGWYRQHGPP